MKRIWEDDDDNYHIIAYNGHGKPCHAITCPRELAFMTWPHFADKRSSACVWIVGKYE